MLFDFFNLYVEKKTFVKAVACTMIFNTASTMTNLSLNSQNRLFSCSGIGLLILREKQKKNDGRWTVKYLSMGSESNVIDGASGKERRQRKTSNTPHGSGKQWKT